MPATEAFYNTYTFLGIWLLILLISVCFTLPVGCKAKLVSCTAGLLVSFLVLNYKNSRVIRAKISRYSSAIARTGPKRKSEGRQRGRKSNGMEYRQSFSSLHSVQLLKISWSRGCIQAITFNKDLSVLHRFFNLFRLLLSITPCGNEFHVVTAAWQSASSSPALNQFSEARNCEGSLPTPLPIHDNTTHLQFL